MRLRIMVMVAIAVWLAGCATAYNAARRVVTDFDTANGLAARLAGAWAKDCAATITKLVIGGQLPEAQDQQDRCDETFGVLKRTVSASIDATGATAEAIDAAEKLRDKNYADAVAKLFAVGAHLVQLFSDAGLPLKIHGVN